MGIFESLRSKREESQSLKEYNEQYEKLQKEIVRFDNCARWLIDYVDVYGKFEVSDDIHICFFDRISPKKYDICYITNNQHPEYTEEKTNRILMRNEYTFTLDKENYIYVQYALSKIEKKVFDILKQKMFEGKLYDKMYSFFESVEDKDFIIKLIEESKKNNLKLIHIVYKYMQQITFGLDRIKEYCPEEYSLLKGKNSLLKENKSAREFIEKIDIDLPNYDKTYVNEVFNLTELGTEWYLLFKKMNNIANENQTRASKLKSKIKLIDMYFESGYVDENISIEYTYKTIINPDITNEQKYIIVIDEIRIYDMKNNGERVYYYNRNDNISKFYNFGAWINHILSVIENKDNLKKQYYIEDNVTGRTRKQ